MASATATKGATGRGSRNVILFYVFLVIFVLVSVFPLLWVFRMSIASKSDLLASPMVTATAPVVGINYSTVFGNPDFIKALRNRSRGFASASRTP
jgi:multiple sugar transport system permease protein